ncbi:MAG: DUF1858 domain-containing protein [Sphaerochaetaceae bacterium]|jgi:hypothetical protein
MVDLRELDLNKSVAQLCEQHKELAPLLAEIGFVEIVKPIMLKTVGKVMTIPKGAAMRSIDLKMVIATLEEHGYKVINATIGE